MRAHNKLAIDYIEEYSKKRMESAKNAIDHVMKMSNISIDQISLLKENIQKKARIAVHFHPYRLRKDSKTVIESMIESGQYKNQFETKISNGSLTAFKGGKRDIWENLLFGQIYEKNEIHNSLRPKYGSLSLIGHSNGSSPRFGSCYFLLKPEMSRYATFTYLDSYTNPKEKGTLKYFDEILASILSECFERDYALGKKNIRPNDLVEEINQTLNQDGGIISTKPMSNNLDHYIEAQIHTEINLLDDADYLVVDSAYRNTVYETSFSNLCELSKTKLIWNKGHELKVRDVPDNFRGTNMPKLANEIAINGQVNAYLLGLAEKRYRNEVEEERINQYKNQQLKYLWHTLVKYG